MAGREQDVLRGARILVTGGSGMLGSHLVDRLIDREADEVIVFDRQIDDSNLASARQSARVSIVRADIRDREVLEPLVARCDIVVHLAALLLLASRQEPRESFEVNLEATFDLLTLAAKHGLPRFVLGSTVGVYGQPDRDELITEASPIGARTMYGTSKFASELYARTFADMYGLRQVALRFGTLYGDRLHGGGFYPKHLLTVLDQIDAGRPPQVEGDPQEVHDFLYVGDAADAVVRVLEEGVDDEVMNIVSGREVSLGEIFETLLEANGTPAQISWLPRTVQWAPRRRFSGALARELTGFTPATSLSEGMDRLVRWRAAQTRPPGR